jgi:hypothetical protein
VSRKTELLLKAFVTYVRPLLEYNSQIWSPSSILDIKKIESVQRAFSKRLPGFRQLHYTERLGRLNTESLELRRLKGDLLMYFKIIHKFVEIDANSLFTFSNKNSMQTRGHCYKIVKPHCYVNCRSNSFCCRSVDAWNSLTYETVTASSIQSFKCQLSHVNLSRFLLCF